MISASSLALDLRLYAEMEDRFDAPPLEAKQLVEPMRLETDLRKLRGLGYEAIAKAVSLHFTEDTPLGPAKVVASRCVES